MVVAFLGCAFGSFVLGFLIGYFVG